MSRLLDTPQVVMTPSRGHGANLSSRDGMVPQDLLSVVSRRRGLVATIIVASLLGAFAVSALLLPKAYESTATLLPQRGAQGAAARPAPRDERKKNGKDTDR